MVVKSRPLKGFGSELPKFRLTLPHPTEVSIIDKELLKSLLAEVGNEDAAIIQQDLDHLEQELMPFFGDHCYQADLYQNCYRLVQFSYITLAFLATVIGSILAFVANEPARPSWLLPLLSFSETVVALIAVFLSAIAPPSDLLNEWLTNRRRAEALRQEWFRYLAHGSPYDVIEQPDERKIRLSSRAAQINAGQQTK